MTFEMLSAEQIQELDSDFLNIDAFFANHDDDLWATPRRDASAHSSADDDWFGSVLDPLMQDPEEAVPVHTKQSSPNKSLLSTRTTSDPNSRLKAEPRAVNHDDEEMHEGAACDDDDERRGCHGGCGHYVPGEVQSDAAGLLDDAGWLDFDRSPLISPSMPLRDRSLLTPNVKAEEYFLDQDEGDFCLPELTDDDVSALVGSTPPGSVCASPLLPLGSTRNNAIVVSPDSTPTSPSFQLSAPPKVVSARKTTQTPARQVHTAASSLKADGKDIPAMVSMFNAMYSPSEAARASSTKSSSAAVAPQPPIASPAAYQGSPLSILVPAPQAYTTAIPLNTAAAKPVTATSATTSSSSSTDGSASVNQFDYFTPPGYPNNARYLDGTAQLNTSLFFNAAQALSPTAKPAVFSSGVAATAQSRAAYAQVQAQAAAAVAMANSAAAISTMRKLNTTYGVPIAPLQRSLHPELKPKVLIAATTAAKAGSLATTKTLLAVAANSASSAASKVTKISITPDISDFKLVQIFHSFCDPANKLINVARFHQLLHHHQGKDEMHAAAAVPKTAAASTSSGASSSSTAAKPLAISQETQRLFKVLDPKSSGFIDLERFMSSFQICNRCTEAKRRAQSAAHSQPVAATAVERQLMEDVAPVIVRVVPTGFEGGKVRSCEHYQWTWCEGFEKTGNDKCRGTNRHDKCPKYLANCTLWKHKLPPKNRKAKVPEHQESPTKKLRHFA